MKMVFGWEEYRLASPAPYKRDLKTLLRQGLRKADCAMMAETNLYGKTSPS